MLDMIGLKNRLLLCDRGFKFEGLARFLILKAYDSKARPKDE